MFHLDNTSGVPEMPEIKEPQSNTPRWFGESVQQGGISWPGADWFNIIQAELLAILELAGTSPDKARHDQIAQSIKQLSNALSTELSKDDGLRYVGTCPHVLALRGIQFTAVGQQVFLKEHTDGSNQGGGIFYCFALESEPGAVDDNGCQIINNTGQIVRRKDITQLSLEMFGGIGGQNIDTAIANMFKASRTFNMPDCYIYMPRNGKPYITSGNNDFNISDGVPFFLHGVSTGRGVPVYHNAENVCFYLHKNHSAQKDFWSSGGIDGFHIVGTSADLLTPNTGSTSIAIRVSDTWNAKIKNTFILGYNAGVGIHLFNDTSWTEGTEVDVMIRGTLIGVWLSRNHNSLTATASFFRTKAKVDFAATINAQCVALRLGNKDDEIDITGNVPRCVLYGHDVDLTAWWEGGSWHSGFQVMKNATAAEDGHVIFRSDGYAMPPGATSEVVHLINCRDATSVFRSRVSNYSGQNAKLALNWLQLVWNSCVYYDYTMAYTDVYAKPNVYPRGLKINFSGGFTVAEQKAGLQFTLNKLPMNIKLKIKIYSYTSQWEPRLEEWLVFVRGIDQPCIVVPAFSTPPFTIQTAAALTSTSGATDNFVKAFTPKFPAFWYGDAARKSLTLRNSTDDNGVSYATNSGMKIRFVLPANPTADAPMNYSVDIEVA